MKPFDTWDYDDANAAVNAALAAQTIDPTYASTKPQRTTSSAATSAPANNRLSPIEVNRRFFEGDHWQGGQGWVGPSPQVTDVGYSEVLSEIFKAFTSKNVVREIIKRHVAGVIGKTPRWGFTPRRIAADASTATLTAEERTLVAEATAIVKQWQDDRDILDVMADACARLLYAERAPTRLYIPAGKLTDATDDQGNAIKVARFGSIAEAIAAIYPEALDPEFATVAEDADTKKSVGVFCFVQQLDAAGNPDASTEDRAELCWIDDNGMTMLRVVGETAPDHGYRFDFGGRLTMHEMRRDVLVTPQVQQNQRALNLALSLLPRNIVAGGFLERVILNGQMPGTWEVDREGVPTGKFIPDRFETGAGTTNFISGIPVKNPDGSTTITTPSIQWRDPVPVDAPSKAVEEHYLAILDEVAQAHTVMSKDARASGKSREQARQEFLNSLLPTAKQIAALGRFLIETPLAMAETLARQPGKYTKPLRAFFEPRLDTGPLTADERMANDGSIGKTISQRTAIARNGVEDVDAELALMANDPATLLETRIKQATGIAALAAIGDIAGAAFFMGVDPDIARALVSGPPKEDDDTEEDDALGETFASQEIEADSIPADDTTDSATDDTTVEPMATVPLARRPGKGTKAATAA